MSRKKKGKATMEILKAIENLSEAGYWLGAVALTIIPVLAILIVYLHSRISKS